MRAVFAFAAFMVLLAASTTSASGCTEQEVLSSVLINSANEGRLKTYVLPDGNILHLRTRSGGTIPAQIHAADGTVVRSSFDAISVSSRQAGAPHMAFPSSGTVMLYTQNQPSGGFYDLKLQRFDANMNRVGSPIAATLVTGGHQSDGAILALPNGKVVVAYIHNFQVRWNIMNPTTGARDFASDQLIDVTGRAGIPSMALLSETTGDFAIVWGPGGLANSGVGIASFTSAGAALHPAVTNVTTITDNSWTAIEAFTHPSGNVAIHLQILSSPRRFYLYTVSPAGALLHDTQLAAGSAASQFAPHADGLLAVTVSGTTLTATVYSESLSVVGTKNSAINQAITDNRDIDMVRLPTALGDVEYILDTKGSSGSRAYSVGCAPCVCPTRLDTNYNVTDVPDAAKTATASIALNTDTWKVEFAVSGVASLTHGHVIAGPVDARSDVASAFPPLVKSPFDNSALWNPPACALSDIDTPAAGLGIAVQYNRNGCQRTYTIEYSLINPAERTSHCQLTNTAGDEILVECELQINSVRAYDKTAPTAFLAKETVFRSNITMPRTLPNEVGTLLHASLAKCSVYAAPDFVVDCRIPSLWNFAPSFAVTQSPSWIIGSSCAQTNGTDATFIRCDLQTLSQIFTEATATIAATVLPSGQVMNFNVNYSLPREETATATGSLATFVKSIGTKDGKFFYGNDDLLTLEIEVVDTARLQISQLELFNSDSPVQSYDLRTTPEFATVETQNATFFVISFYPARILDDGNFYRHGPHGVNVSFLFTAARRQAEAEQSAGVVTYRGLGVKGQTASQGNGKAADSTANTSGASNTAVIAIAAGAVFAAVAIVAAAAVVVARRSGSAAPTTEKQSPSTATAEDVAPVAEAKVAAVCDVAEVPDAPAAVAVEMDEV